MAHTTTDKDMSLDEATARLAASLPDYEDRPPQRRFSEAVVSAIGSRRHLLAEAGTGTGKALGYLIPAIISGKRTVVSTATKALQDQVVNKDLPFLAEHLGVDFTFALLKGRSNYLCINAVEVSEEANSDFAVILRLSADQKMPEGFTGCQDEVEALLGHSLEVREWMAMAADSDVCSSLRCRKRPEGCYAQQAKERAEVANVVVVNHALYMTHLSIIDKTSGNVDLLGTHHVAIFDEAHEIEEYASSVFGFRFSPMSFSHLATEARGFVSQHDPRVAATFTMLAEGATNAAEVLWSVLKVGRISAHHFMVTVSSPLVELSNAIYDLREAFALSSSPSDTKAKAGRARIEARLNNMVDHLTILATAPPSELVRWVEEERAKTGGTRLVLRAAPLEVSPILRRLLFEEGGEVTSILASATMSVNGSMGYISGRLGIDEFDWIDVGTPFDYPEQSVLLVPANLPDPSRERPAWSSLSVSAMRDLITMSGGRALVLFTSYTEMRIAYDILSTHLPYHCIMQGQKSNKALADEFASDESSVLFATRSFMTGVDFQGDTLRLVIINKMPFPVPTEPLTEARCEAIESRGGNPFADYSVPVMTLILKQAFGRLIRHRNDSGVVAILDPRLVNKGYGRGIVRSLPPARLITEVEGAREMLERV